MPAAPRARPSDLFTPAEWTPFHARSSWRGPRLVGEVAGGYLAALREASAKA